MGKGKITVFGSFVVDLAFRTPKLPIKGETIKGLSYTMGPGGKGSNQAVAAKRAGADVIMITRVGADPFANFAFESFQKEGLDTRYIFKDLKEKTAVAAILVDDNSGENQIVVTLGACLHFTDNEIDSIRALIANSEYLLVQLESNLDAIERVIQIAYDERVKVILNPAPAAQLPDSLLKMVDILTPNETEAAILAGLDINQSDQPNNIKKAADILLGKGINTLIITLGDKGVFLKALNIEKSYPALAVKAVDTTGAGDAFNGGLATALSEGKNLDEAIRFANIVGGLSVTREGAAQSMPYRDEIEKWLKK